ncbi:MAG: DUF4214 domain-containing protein, partial [Planctomycetota bacterium]
MAASDEFYQTVSGGTDPGFVNNLYKDLLSRMADTAGFNSFVQSLSSAEASSRQVLSNLLTRSDEYLGNLVASAFQKYLQRPASSTDVTNWVNAFHNGARDEDLIAGLMGSGEYFATRAGNDNNK